MSHVPYSTHAVNSQSTHVHTVQQQHCPVITVDNAAQPVYTVNSQPPLIHVHNTPPRNIQTVQSNPPPEHPPTNPTANHLLNQLQPLLLHQHSTLTTVNALLTPHLHQQGPLTPETMKTLTTLLQDCPTARHLLSDTSSRPTRRRTTPNYCDLDHHHQPLPRPNVSFPPSERLKA